MNTSLDKFGSSEISLSPAACPSSAGVVTETGGFMPFFARTGISALTATAAKVATIAVVRHTKRVFFAEKVLFSIIKPP